jgi:hypothetical protein
MRLIALRSFRNNIEPRIDLDGDATTYEDHIPKGTIFSIGVDKSGKEITDAELLTKTDERNIGLLQMSGCIGDANDERLVKKIQAEVAEESAAEERNRMATLVSSPADVNARIAEANRTLPSSKRVKE